MDFHESKGEPTKGMNLEVFVAPLTGEFNRAGRVPFSVWDHSGGHGRTVRRPYPPLKFSRDARHVIVRSEDGFYQCALITPLTPEGLIEFGVGIEAHDPQSEQRIEQLRASVRMVFKFSSVAVREHPENMSKVVHFRGVLRDDLPFEAEFEVVEDQKALPNQTKLLNQ